MSGLAAIAGEAGERYDQSDNEKVILYTPLLII